jgi:hypothetical protein
VSVGRRVWLFTLAFGFLCYGYLSLGHVCMLYDLSFSIT